MLMLRYCDARCTPGFSEETCDDRSPNACAGLSFRSVLQGTAVNYLPVFCNMEIDLSISFDELGNNYSVLVLCQCYVGKGTCTSFGGSDSLVNFIQLDQISTSILVTKSKRIGDSDIPTACHRLLPHD
nr:PREDICTED: uncharacterized protein LOC108952430 [Musa acuminata subsp. malaccensis]